MLENLKLPAVVLSYGRSGSVLIAHNIARKLHTLPVYIKHLPAGKFIVGHSHLLPAETCNIQCTRIFAVRNCLEAALSFALAKDQGVYHCWANETYTPKTQEVDVLSVQSYLNYYKIWHKQYIETITPADLVITYEKFKDALITEQVYQETFPNKKMLVSNYDTVETVCKDLINECNILTQAFCDHVNLVDVYQLASD